MVTAGGLPGEPPGRLAVGQLVAQTRSEGGSNGGHLRNDRVGSAPDSANSCDFDGALAKPMTDTPAAWRAVIEEAAALAGTGPERRFLNARLAEARSQHT
jgi:hypothetical protein